MATYLSRRLLLSSLAAVVATSAFAQGGFLAIPKFYTANKEVEHAVVITQNGKRVRRLPGYFVVGAAPAWNSFLLQSIVGTGQPGTDLYRVTPTGKPVKFLSQSGGGWIMAAVSPDGQRFVTSTRDGFEVRRSSNGEVLLTLTSDELMKDVYAPNGQDIDSWGNQVVWHPDGKHLLYDAPNRLQRGQPKSRTFSINLATRERRSIAPGAPVAFTAGRNLLTFDVLHTGRSSGLPESEGGPVPAREARLYSPSGKLLQRKRFEGVADVSFDGKHVVVARMLQIRPWRDPATGKTWKPRRSSAMSQWVVDYWTPDLRRRLRTVVVDEDVNRELGVIAALR